MYRYIKGKFLRLDEGPAWISVESNPPPPAGNCVHTYTLYMAGVQEAAGGGGPVSLLTSPVQDSWGSHQAHHQIYTYNSFMSQLLLVTQTKSRILSPVKKQRLYSQHMYYYSEKSVNSSGEICRFLLLPGPVPHGREWEWERETVTSGPISWEEQDKPTNQLWGLEGGPANQLKERADESWQDARSVVYSVAKPSLPFLSLNIR
jgi:hypothetical protein